MARMITGIVSSKKTDKTIVVTEHVRLTHPLYRKQYTVSKRFMAHDEKNEAQEGDKVVIIETRPISARKHFTLKSIVQKARVQHVESENALEAYVDTSKDKHSQAAKKSEAKTEEQSTKSDVKDDEKSADVKSKKQPIGFTTPDEESKE
ncbi:MAG TPA: 30S ribosomal protein S17 [Candidatus Saccharimonadales bacterium]|nr:30S ribosomal protein S17 [Candidatus Saccharimonadales bacterium]